MWSTKDNPIYHERMLQIADHPTPTQAKKNKALQTQSQWVDDGLFALWYQCSNIDEFARRGGISLNKARALYNRYRKLYKHPGRFVHTSRVSVSKPEALTVFSEKPTIACPACGSWEHKWINCDKRGWRQ